MRSFLTALGNEVYKGLRFAWAERLQIIIELPMFAAFILLMGPILAQGNEIASGDLTWSLESQSTSILIAWFVPFLFFYLQIIKLFWRLLNEIQSGTLEQVYLSPLPSWLVAAAGRAVAAVLETLVVAAGIYGIVRVFVSMHFNVSVALLLPAALIIVTGVGFSLIIAGATLVWKRIEMVAEASVMVCFMGSAAVVPLVTLPSWWENIGQFLPLNAGIDNIFGVLFRNESATALWGEGGLVWVLVVAAAYLTLGVLAFRLGEKAAKRRGALGRY